MADIKYLTVPHLNRKELARIFSKISVNRETGCWEWTGSLCGKGARKGKGYARVGYQGGAESAHRLMYAWLVEPIPRGFNRNLPVLDHAVCNNTRCCFPGHLKLTSQRTNILRGEGACANNAKKTHCPKKHLLPTKPDFRYGRGRRCPICLAAKRHDPAKRERKAAYDRAYRDRKKASSNLM